MKTLLAAEPHIVSAVKMNAANRYCVHELFGFDILLDRELKPWLIEVNISPSLHSDSPLDISIKGEMLKDLLNLAGYRLPEPSLIRSGDSSKDDGTNSPLNKTKTPSFFDRRLVSPNLSVDERNKHSYYMQHMKNEAVMRTILDTITPDDLRILTEFEDERSRMGGFEPLFPTLSTRSQYLSKMMEPPRYYNLLIDAWLRCYGEETDADGNPINRHEKGE